MPAPPILRDNGQESTTLDVLTYNIEGLAWPARQGRRHSLQQIGTILADLNRQGAGPDVILVQEMFSRSSVHAIAAAGYPYQIWGPTRTQRPRTTGKGGMSRPFRWSKGETGFHLLGSGLAILSRYPIIGGDAEPFGTRRCAGIDCLSNKGMQQAEIVVPGVPQRIELFNTHLNSQQASRVPTERTIAAHALQVDDLSSLISSSESAKLPAILGGDFNMQAAPDRLNQFESAINRFTMVHRFCALETSGCDVRLSWDGDEPWLDTQDLQLFRNGAAVTVTPMLVDAMFDGAEGQPRLSDHDGFMVRYRLSWPAEQPVRLNMPGCTGSSGGR